MLETDESFRFKYLQDWGNPTYWKLLGEGTEANIYVHKDRPGQVIREEKESDVSKELEAGLGKTDKIVSMLAYSPTYTLYPRQNGGDLQDYITDRFQEIPDFSKRLDICASILEGMAYIHDRGFVHYDFKPDNVLIHEEPGEISAKVTDFGRLQRYTTRNPEFFADRYYPYHPTSRMYAASSDYRSLDVHATCYVILGVLAWHPEILCQQDEIDEGGGCRIPGVLFEINDLQPDPRTTSILKKLISRGRYEKNYAKLTPLSRSRVDVEMKKVETRYHEVLTSIGSLLKSRSGYSFIGLGPLGKEIWRGIMGVDFALDSETTTSQKLLDEVLSLKREVSGKRR